MANWKGLLVIGLSLVALCVFLMQPPYGIGRISEHHPIHNTDWEKDLELKGSSSRKLNDLELKGSSSRKLKEIPANVGKPLVLTVDKNRGQGAFSTVQEAINAVPVNNKNPVEITVKPGIYREKVAIPAEKPFISLSGLDAMNTVITWNDSAQSGHGTYKSETMAVYASDFTARKITIQNSYGPVNQAVAVRISGDRCAFYDCRFLGYQDTVLDESGKHYFQNCFIEGAVDVICGNGKSIYQSCELHAIPIHNGAFTAQRRSSPSEDSGFVFLKCKLTGKGFMSLGRAWGPYSTVLYANTYMDNIIFPEGWDNWNDPARQKTVNFGQYQCEGPGAAQGKRVPWSRAFTNQADIAQYLSLSYIDGDKWIRI